MAFFKSFKKGTITILEDANDVQSDGTTLYTYPSLTGPHAIETPSYDGSGHIPRWTFQQSRSLATFQPTKSTSEKRSADVWMLKSAHHDQNAPQTPFVLLSDRMFNGSVQWSGFRANGAFSYTERYWEWLEDILSRNGDLIHKTGLYRAVFASLFSYDRVAPVVRAFCEYWCPNTNTLHTSCGEMSISLRDLTYICGLPITGRFYDEVVPPIEEFSAKSKGGEPVIPKSCKFLFLAYHKLCKDDKGQKVKIVSWIQYWYKGSVRYKRPPAKSVRNKKDAPQNTYNPSGEIHEVQARTDEDSAPFEDLGVDDEDIESTYLAAFYACWLCLFVFPMDDMGLIRPSVFKVASKMSQGYQFCLAIPVLANIYQGLNEISASKDPGNCSATLPFHYVYAWLAEYFGTHFYSPLPDNFKPSMVHFSGAFSAKHFGDAQARSLFNACSNVGMDTLAMIHKERKVIVDRENISRPDIVYLICLRSGLLTLRQDNRRVIQPYSPHRFSRQFGYVQDVPGGLKKDTRTGALSLMYWHWESLTKRETGSTLTLPPESALTEYMVTRGYVEWWSKVYCSTPKKTTAEMPVGGSQHKPPKVKEDKIVTRTAPPRQKVVPREVELDNNPHASSIKALPPSNTRPTQTQLLEGNGDSSDPHVSGSRLKLKLKGIEAPAKRSSESSSSGNVNFKRRRIELDLGSTFFDPNNEFPLNTDFLGDVPGSPQSTPRHVQLDGHPLFEDEACSDAIRVPSTEVLKAHSISKDVTCNDQNELQQVGHKDLYATETSPKPLNKMTLSEVTHDAADVVDTSQGLRKIRMQAASQVCEQIEGIITNYSLRTILSKKGDIDELIDELHIYGVDPSSVKDKVDRLMASATQYSAARLACSHKAPTGSSDHHLTHAESNIAKLTKLRQANLDKRQTAIEALENLKKEQQRLEQIISSSDATLLRHDKQLADFENEKARIKETMEVTAEELEKVKKLGDVFEEQRNSFKGLTWM